MAATVKALVLWWGGSGWARIGAGWGWGGYTYDAAFVVTPQAYTITVGTGGAAVTSVWWTGVAGNTGNNSVFSTLTWYGWGGWGAYNWFAAKNWGCWGWGTYNLWTGWTASQWYAGATNVWWVAAGWWGGMWAIWVAESGSNGGAGGAGLANSISWASVTYGGGWWGSGNTTATSGAGWTWGGGAGAGWTDTPATSGTNWLGGGGGWVRNIADSGSKVSGKWWDWVVIISYATDGSDGVSPSSTGGTITTSGGQTIHTFTSSWTFTMVSSSNSNFFMFF